MWNGGEGACTLDKEVREAEARKRLMGGMGNVRTVEGGCLEQWGQAKAAGGDLMAKSSLDSLSLPNSSCSSGFCFLHCDPDLAKQEMSDRKLFQCKITDVSFWNIMDWAHDVSEADLDFQGCQCVLGAFAYSWRMGTSLLFPYPQAVFTLKLYLFLLLSSREPNCFYCEYKKTLTISLI